MYSRALDNSRAMNNGSKIIREYFQTFKDTLSEYRIKPHKIHNMDDKGFLIGLIQRSRRVIVPATEKTALRQPGNRETITVIEAVGVFGDIPRVITMKGEKHMYGWYSGDLPETWTTAISPNGWTDAAGIRLALRSHLLHLNLDSWPLSLVISVVAWDD